MVPNASRRRAAALAQHPLELRRREVRVEDEAGALADQLGAAARRSGRRCGGPARRSRCAIGVAGLAVPDERRLALVRDPDRVSSRLDACVERAAPQRVEHALPDLLGVVLDPARLREVLRQLRVARGRRSLRLLVDDEAGGAGRALVDREDHGDDAIAMRARSPSQACGGPARAPARERQARRGSHPAPGEHFAYEHEARACRSRSSIVVVEDRPRRRYVQGSCCLLDEQDRPPGSRRLTVSGDAHAHRRCQDRPPERARRASRTRRGSRGSCRRAWCRRAADVAIVVIAARPIAPPI